MIQPSPGLKSKNRISYIQLIHVFVYLFLENFSTQLEKIKDGAGWLRIGL